MEHTESTPDGNPPPTTSDPPPTTEDAVPEDLLNEFESFDNAFEEVQPSIKEQEEEPTTETADLPHEDSEILIKPKRTRKSKAEKDAEREQKKQLRERQKEERQRAKDEVKRLKEEAAQAKQLEKDRAEAMMACQRELRESAVKIKDVFGKSENKSQDKAKKWFDTCCEEANTASSQPGIISAGSFTRSSPTQVAPSRLTRMNSMIRLTQDESDLGPQEILDLDDDSNDFDLVLDIVDDEDSLQKQQSHEQEDEAAQLREQQLIEHRHELMKFQSSNSIKFEIDVDDSQSQSVMEILERTNSMGHSNSSFIRSRKSMISTKSFAGKDFSALRARSGKDTSTTVMFKGGDDAKNTPTPSSQQAKTATKPGANKLHNLLATTKSKAKG